MSMQQLIDYQSIYVAPITCPTYLLKFVEAGP